MTWRTDELVPGWHPVPGPSASLEWPSLGIAEQKATSSLNEPCFTALQMQIISSRPCFVCPTPSHLQSSALLLAPFSSPTPFHLLAAR